MLFSLINSFFLSFFPEGEQEPIVSLQQDLLCRRRSSLPDHRMCLGVLPADLSPGCSSGELRSKPHDNTCPDIQCHFPNTDLNIAPRVLKKHLTGRGYILYMQYSPSSTPVVTFTDLVTRSLHALSFGLK